MYSIKVKLIVLIACCTLFATVLLGGISIVRMSLLIDKSSQNTIQLQCQAIKETLDIKFENIQQAVDSMKDIILGEAESLNLLLHDANYRHGFTRRLEEMNKTISFHTRGAMAYYFWYNPEFFPVSEGYFWVYNPRFTRFFSKPIPDVRNFNEYQVPEAGRYFLPRKARKSTWITPYKSLEADREIVSYVVPIYIRGTFIGVLGMDMNYDLIVDELKDIPLYKTGHAYVLDADNYAVYHKDFDPGDVVFLYETNTLNYSLELRNGWVLTVSVLKKELNAERNALFMMLLLATLIVAGIFIFISFRLTAHIINPLMQLVVATRKLANGDLNVKLPTNSNDEIGILAKSFQETMAQLPNYLYRDSLTGVQNVASYQRSVADVKKRMEGGMLGQFAVVVCDVNNLKYTNDTYGHEVGNDLITSASMLICDVFSHAPVFRIGGDEFVVFLEKQYEEREKLILDFKVRLQRSAVFAGRDRLPVSVAVGLASYDPLADKTYDDLFNRADEAMYKDKEVTKKRLHMPSRSE